MNQSLTLPMADKFYHDKQTSAFIRSVNVSWEKPEKDHYYLEYSYNQKDWYALNGGFPIVLPCDELSVTDALETQDPNGETISVAALSSLQNKYGKPEPVCIQSVERCESDPETVQVTYTNGMKEIRNIIRILSRKTKNNPVLIGEPGVGKTAAIEGLAQRIVAGDVPEGLKNKKIFALDMEHLLQVPNIVVNLRNV